MKPLQNLYTTYISPYTAYMKPKESLYEPYKLV